MIAKSKIKYLGLAIFSNITSSILLAHSIFLRKCGLKIAIYLTIN